MKKFAVTSIMLSLLFGFLFIVGIVDKSDAEQLPEPIQKELKKASQLYFDRCAGWHGLLRKGATGPSLLPEKTKGMGDEYLIEVMTNGTPGGMPDWGRQGLLNKEQLKLLAKYMQLEPVAPPELSMAEIKKSWKLIVPPNKRPKKPMHSRDWQNFFGVIMRDAGQVAIVDGSSYELVNVINTGYAVHIIRVSASGRYMYSIGRDGRTTLIDLWLETPDKVAEIKTCYDARSVDTSKYEGKYGDFKDKYAIVGCYWPPSFIILEGDTLEPLKITGTSGYTYDTNEFLREARVASIVASHTDPMWVVNIKELGQVWLVNYEDINNLKVSMVNAERFLHDGGWDITKRYFLVAANMRNKVAVIDTVEKKLEAIVETGTKPHPGRGANVYHIEQGPIWCTGHLGSPEVVCIGVDKRNFPENAWKVVKKIKLPGEGGGNLFVKTHHKSKWIIADRTLHSDLKLQRSFHVIDKESLEVVKTIEIPQKFKGRVVHIEYNKGGNEFWVSVWGNVHKPKENAILVYDDKTLKVKKEITGDWVKSPTGKFNVYNTMRDVY